MKNVPPDIFKAYDIRGRYPQEINESVVRTVAAALPRLFGRGRVVVGRDARLSSPRLYQAAIRGLQIAKPRLRIVRAGMITTPMLYFLVGRLRAAGGIMVTASHNPKEFNGIKAIGRHAVPVGGDQIRRMVEKVARRGRLSFR